jgi:hypothetical protein
MIGKSEPGAGYRAAPLSVPVVLFVDTLYEFRPFSYKDGGERGKAVLLGASSIRPMFFLQKHTAPRSAR